MKKTKIVKLFFVILVSVILWFLVVDLSQFVEECDDCFYSKDIFEFRILTLPIYRIEREYESPIAYTAKKLGVACLHNNINRWHRQRRWGMLICFRPCHTSVYRLSSSDDKNYELLIDENIQEYLNKHPDLPREFKQRVLFEHNIEYWEQLKNKLFLQKPTNSEPK